MIASIIITFGWWILPAVITLICLVGFFLMNWDNRNRDGGALDFMEIQIEKVHAPMWEFKLSENPKIGTRVSIRQRTFKKYLRVMREYHKAQAELQKILADSRT